MRRLRRVPDRQEVFLGLVLGDCLMASFWSLVGAATKVEYPPFSGIA